MAQFYKGLLSLASEHPYVAIQPLKISILLPDLRGGGVERVRIVLAHEFARLGHEPEFVLMQARGELIHDAQLAFPVFDLGCSRIRQVPIRLAQYLSATRPGALLAAMWPLTAVAPAVCTVSSRRTRLLVSEHGIISAQYRDRGRAHQLALRSSISVGYRLADARVGVSQGVVEDMGQLSNLGREHFSVINNPVPVIAEPTNSALAAADSLWGVPVGGRILSVGRLKQVKNHALMLRAFAQLNRPEVKLMLLGSGKLESDLRKLAAELEIADQVIFPGFYPDPTPFYCTADLFVLSSNYEGFGNVIVEALANGTPVVSTDCPSGPAEILAGGKFGTLVPVNDAEALAKAMGEVLGRTHNPERLRIRARDFAPERAARAYLDLLGLGTAQ